MTVETRSGMFSTGTGAIGSTIDIIPPDALTISGTSVLFLFYNGRTETTDTLGRASYFRGVGAAISSTIRRACCSQGVDANAAHDGGSRYTNEGCIVSVALESTEDGRIDFDSWRSDGARLIVDDVMPRDARVGYWMITGLTNADIANFLDQSVTGNFNITSLPFQPDAGLFVGTGNDGTAPPHSRNGASKLSLGFGVSSAKQAVWSGVEDEGSATSDTDSYCIDGVEVIASHLAAAGTSIGSRIGLVAWLSNGTTLNQLEVPATLEQNFAVFMQGGSWDVQSIQTRTDGNDINTASLGFTPTGVLAISAYKAEHTQDVPTVHQTMSIGSAHNATNRWCISLMDEDGLADTEITLGIEHDAIYQSITTASATEGLMDVKTWADPITFIMDDFDPSAKFLPLLIVGNPAGAILPTKVQSLKTALFRSTNY